MADDQHVEIVTFSLPEAYVYAIPPTATHAGHRADSWNVDKWLRAVRVKVTSKGDKGAIKLEDVESGELFAECPLPRDAPVSTVVEPVTDSSRYFVLRVEDEASRRHAFVGLGFRERDAASDFKLAVQEHQSQLNRDKEAARARLEYEKQLTEKVAAAAAAGMEGVPTKLHDFSLKGTVHIAVPKTMGGGSGGGDGGGRGTQQPAPLGGGAGGLGVGIPPPPSAASFSGVAVGLAPPPRGGTGVGAGVGVGTGAAMGGGGGLMPPPASASAGYPAQTVAPAAAAAAGGAAEQGWASFDSPAAEGDDWADFQS